MRTIIGGGLAGPLFALYQAKRGHQVTIYEGRPDPRIGVESAGRSINLALSVRGMTALQKIGLDVSQIAIPMYGRLIHSIDGQQTFQKYGKGDQAIYSISRSQLNKVLLNEAEKQGVTIIFESRVVNYDPKQNVIQIKTNDQILNVQSELVIAADGYNSKIREALSQVQNMNVTRSNESHGYKELNIISQNGHHLDKNSLHIWPRGSFMLIALPNQTGDWTCTLFLALEGDVSFERLITKEQIQQFFNQYFPDIAEYIPDLVEQFQRNPVGKLCTVKTENWNYEDKCILIGDAAHSLVPFYGQGMNAAFEDCQIFDQLYDKNKELKQILQEFYLSRKPNTDAISDMAVMNFIEMRDLVSEKFFQLKKQCEAQIALKYEDFIPKYALVSFSNIPYDIAKRRGEIIDEVLTEQCKKEFDVDEAYKKIIERYAQLNL